MPNGKSTITCEYEKFGYWFTFSNYSKSQEVGELENPWENQADNNQEAFYALHQNTSA